MRIDDFLVKARQVRPLLDDLPDGEQQLAESLSSLNEERAVLPPAPQPGRR